MIKIIYPKVLTQNRYKSTKDQNLESGTETKAKARTLIIPRRNYQIY